MTYRYVIRKIPTNQGTVYIPIILNKGNWRYLIKNDGNFMVSSKTKSTFENLLDAYKFIASHRMAKDLKGKDRPKCLFFKEGLSMVPIVGLFYTIPKLISKIPLKYMFSTPITLSGAAFIQLLTIILILIFI